MGWRDHLPHVLIFCRTHVLRAFRKKFPGHPATSIIKMILNATTKREVVELIDNIINK